MKIKLNLFSLLIILCYSFNLYSYQVKDKYLNVIFTQLDFCLSEDIKYQIKYTSEAEFVKDGLSSNRIKINLDTFNNSIHCFYHVDTLIHTDTNFINYFGNLLEDFDNYILEIINKEYHRYLNGLSVNFEKDIDSLRELVLKYDSTVIAWKTNDTIDGFYIPFDLQDSYLHMRDLFIQTDIDNFKNKKDEDYAVGSEHIGMGLRIRNAWKLGGSRLNEYFSKKDIHDHDIISEIILRAWYRKLNNKPLDLEKLIKEYQEYQKRND